MALTDWNAAAAPVPSAKPEVPEPTNVETAPEGVTLRITPLPLSLTNTLPPASTRRSFAALNSAAPPTPSA
ncbi:MAG: hypothetical protein ABW032_12555 [Burkholderiaceae bacterium]